MRFSVVILMLFVASSSLWGNESILSFAEPSSLRYTGMGGAITAVPEGLDMLLHNPASFTESLPRHRDKFILSIPVQLYFKPQYLFPILKDVWDVENQLGQMLLNAKDLITSSGIGATPYLSMGYLGRAWGVGLLFTTSAFLQGKPFPLGVEGYVMGNLSIPLAYSLRVVKGRLVDVSVGAGLRPSVALYKMLDGSDVDAIVAGRTDVDDLLDGILTTPYLSIPADLGILMVGHDLLYDGSQLRLAATLKNLFGDYFVPGQSIEPLPRELSFNLGVGLFLPMQIGRLPLDVVVSAETKSLNQLLSGSQTFFKSLAFGLELAMADFIRFWGGLSSGYPAVGGEVDFGFFSLGAAWQTIESGRYVGDNPLSIFHLGISLEF